MFEVIIILALIAGVIGLVLWLGDKAIERSIDNALGGGRRDINSDEVEK
jgi:hypothetical protein